MEIGGYVLGKVLGKGKFGKVRVAYRMVPDPDSKTDAQKRETYAMKVILKDQVENTGDLSRIRRETKILLTLQHPNIIRCYDVFETSKEICIVMEYADGGDLYNYIATTQHGSLTLNESCRLFRQMVSAVRYCHTHQIVHRDLKPENIFLDKNKNVKIGDFGFSRVYKFESGLSTPCGSLAYVAPEVISGKDYIGPSADVWSLGCIFYVMVVGRLPFDAMTNPEIVDRIRKGNFHDHLNLTDRTRKFLRRVLYPNPIKRFRIPEIAVHSAIWEDKSMLQKVLKPFAMKLAYSKPYHKSAMGLTLQRSYSESQLLSILTDFREKRSQNFLSDNLISQNVEPETVEEDPFIPKENFSFPRLAKLDNPDYYHQYYDSLKNQPATQPTVPTLDFSQLNNNNNNVEEEIEKEHYYTDNGVKIFIPRVANKLNSSGSPTTLRMVALRRSQAQPHSSLSKEASPNIPHRKPSLSRSTSSGNL